MTARARAVFVLLAAAVPGLLFASVFGLPALLAPVGVVVAAGYVAVEFGLWLPRLAPWRPLLAVLLGMVALGAVELPDTTVDGLPTAATVHGLLAGVTDAWRLTLQSTWPVRPDAALLLFVPLAVLFVAVLGVELLRWPAVALMPGVALLAVSQTFAAVTGAVATVAALGYAVLAAGLLAVSRPKPSIPATATITRCRAAVVLAVPTVLLGVLGAVLAPLSDTGRVPPLTLHQHRSAPLDLPPLVSPLDTVAERLRRPNVPVFQYTSDSPVDRWRLVVLTEFNGVSWLPDTSYQRMGASLAPSPLVTVPTVVHGAQVTLPPDVAGGPWVPSQAMPMSVGGIAPLIDPDTGVLLVPGSDGARYRLTWREPRVTPSVLADAALDDRATAPGDGLGAIPSGISDLARTATDGLRPSFRTALLLERYLRQHYRVATGAGLPTGSGWSQLRTFLLDTRRGTSEQFAAAYVALARIVGMPARLAVGFRAPRSTGTTVVVRNRDVLAWPEVAVAGVGWVPLDPTGSAAPEGSAPAEGVAAATAQVRRELPPPQDIHDPPLPTQADTRLTGGGLPWWVPLGLLVAVPLALVVVLTVTTPVWTALRTWRRRRRAGLAGVLAALAEVRDLMRAHGLPWTPGMTVRDLAAAAGPLVELSVVDSLLSLARQVDLALWSGSDVDADQVGQVWVAVGAIRRGLSGRRLRARFDPRGLFGPRVAPATG